MENPDTLSIERETLRMGKYTRGFDKLTTDQLHGLLWLLGEWTVRGDNGHPRSTAAREALKTFNDKPCTLEEVHELMRGARATALRGEIQVVVDEP